LPEAVPDPARAEGVDDRGVRPAGPLDGVGGARRQVLEMGEPTLPAGDRGEPVQQRRHVVVEGGGGHRSILPKVADNGGSSSGDHGGGVHSRMACLHAVRLDVITLGPASWTGACRARSEAGSIVTLTSLWSAPWT